MDSGYPVGVSRHFEDSKHLCNLNSLEQPPMLGQARGTTTALISNFAGLWLLQENPRNLVFLSGTPLIISETPQCSLTLLRISVVVSGLHVDNSQAS